MHLGVKVHPEAINERLCLVTPCQVSLVQHAADVVHRRAHIQRAEQVAVQLCAGWARNVLRNIAFLMISQNSHARNNDAHAWGNTMGGPVRQARVSSSRCLAVMPSQGRLSTRPYLDE